MPVQLNPGAQSQPKINRKKLDFKKNEKNKYNKIISFQQTIDENNQKNNQILSTYH